MEIGGKSEGLTSFVVVQQNIKQMIGIHFSIRKKTPKLQNQELVGKALAEPIKFTGQSRSELGP